MSEKGEKVGDLTLIKLLGKGAFGEVYLSQKDNSNKFFATKKIDRKIADRPKFQKYLINEINILKMLNHPNIVKLEDVKQSTKSYYIVMEYINGGVLTDCLKKYIEKNGKAFPEEIVQHLMRQIVEAFVYIHGKNIIHRDLKLDNIMVHFDNPSDKENLNMMKAKIKIIDFGFSIVLSKENLASTTVGSPINMDPIILEKFNKLRDKNASYDTKADIWSIGTVCYELFIGKAVFDAETMEALVEKVKGGTYKVPSTISKELVNFLNNMLQYDATYRPTAKELQSFPFLAHNVKDFHHVKADKTTKSDNLKVNKNKSIWAIYNNEDKFININERNSNKNNNNPPQQKNQIKKEEEKKIEKNNQYHQHHNNVEPKVRKEYQRAKTMGAPAQKQYSFYGQVMSPNVPPQTPPIANYNKQLAYPFNTMPQYAYPQPQPQPYFGVPMPYAYPGYPPQNQYPKVPPVGYAYNYANLNRAMTGYPPY